MLTRQDTIRAAVCRHDLHVDSGTGKGALDSPGDDVHSGSGLCHVRLEAGDGRMMPFIHGIRVVVGMLLLLAVAKVAQIEPSTTAVEHSAQHPGEAPEVAEAPAVVAIPPAPSWTTPAKVIRVIDGDTLEMELRHTIRVRLLDCWAPESKSDPRLPESDRSAAKARGLAARQHLRDLCEGREVILHVPTDGSGDLSRIWTLGRVLGRVWVDGVEVSERQVEGGFATREKRNGKE